MTTSSSRDGTRLAPSRAVEAGAGAAVLLLHGFTGRGDRLGAVPRRPSTGLTSRRRGPPGPRRARTRRRRPRATRVERQAADLATILRARGAAPAHVVGYSLGARVALRLARRPPRRRPPPRSSRARRPASPTRRTAQTAAPPTTTLAATHRSSDGIDAFVDALGGACRSSPSDASLPPARAARLRAARLAQRPARPRGHPPWRRPGGHGAAPRPSSPTRHGPDPRGRRRPRPIGLPARGGGRRRHPGSRAWDRRPTPATPRNRESPASAFRRLAHSDFLQRRFADRSEPHEHRHLDLRRRVQRHPLRALRHGHRQGHHRPPGGPQRLPARRPCASSSTRSRASATTRAIGCVLLTGAGDKAFCSGGDQHIQEPAAATSAATASRASTCSTSSARSARCRSRSSRSSTATPSAAATCCTSCATCRSRPRTRSSGRWAQGRLLRRRVRDRAAGAPRGRQEGQGDLVPVPPVHARRRRWTWAS